MKLAKSGALDDSIIIGRQKISRMLNLNKGSGNLLGDIEELSKETGFGVRETPISVIQSTKIVNPGYSTGKPEYTNNCFSAVTADVVNRINNGKGLMCQAREATVDEIKNGGMTFNNVAKVWKNSSIDDIAISKDALKDTESIKNNLSDKIKNYCKSDSGIGLIRIKSAITSSSGHFLKFEIKNGEVFLSDSQSGTMTKVDRYLNAIATGKLSRGIEILNCDGLEIDPRALTQIVKSL